VFDPHLGIPRRIDQHIVLLGYVSMFTLLVGAVGFLTTKEPELIAVAMLTITCGLWALIYILLVVEYGRYREVAAVYIFRLGYLGLGILYIVGFLLTLLDLIYSRVSKMVVNFHFDSIFDVEIGRDYIVLYIVITVVVITGFMITLIYTKPAVQNNQTVVYMIILGEFAAGLVVTLYALVYLDKPILREVYRLVGGALLIVHSTLVYYLARKR